MSYREIPYNYTSFSDREIVYRLLGKKAWHILESLRADRKTGLSAKMLFEILGDIWIVRRNPYLQEDLLNNKKRLKALTLGLAHRLNQIIKRAGEHEKVVSLIKYTKISITDFNDFLTELEKSQTIIYQMLRKITSHDNIRFDALSRAAHSTDASDWRVEYPIVVITPDTENEVASLVKACIKLGLSIIPRGGGTGYTGSGVPLTHKTAVINTEKLLTIGAVKNNLQNKKNEKDNPCYVRVGAGVITRRVSELATKHGRIFAIDPTSEDASTIGGNIAMNAGGKKAVRFGTTLDNLRAWKMVLPTGNWLEIKRLHHNLGKIHLEKFIHFELNYLADDVKTIIKQKRISIDTKTIRYHALGKDVTNKFLGGLPGVQKEGCDGLITSAEFILHPKFALVATLCLEFFDAKIHQAVSAIVDIKNHIDNNPETELIGLEHLDFRYIKAIHYTTKAQRTQLPKMVLLIDFEAKKSASLKVEIKHIRDLATHYDGACFVAKDEQERKIFWRDRENTAAIAAHTNAFKINEDVVIPLDRLAEYNDEIERINLRLSIENKLKTLIAIETCLSNFNKQQQVWLKEKYQLAQNLINKVKKGWQNMLDNLNNAQVFAKLQSGEHHISLNLSIKNPLFDLYVGELFNDLRTTIEKIHKKYKFSRLFIATHMHAGDGNVHTNIPVHSHIPEMLAQANKVVDEIMDLANKLGGVISGEHGIGLTKFRYLSDKHKKDFARYKQKIDPNGNFNRGKLLIGSNLDNAYTPSLRLLEKEAIILENSEIGEINNMTKSCVRCGKCKPVCTTHVPEANLLYSPRDKIIGSNLIIEAFLYEEQTRRGVSFAHFDELDDIADHCTICHRCYTPCPVDIDFGDVSMKMRHILKKHHKKHDNILAKMAMVFLNSTKPFTINVAKNLLNIGYRSQHILSKLAQPFIPKKIPSKTIGRANFATEIITLLDKPLPKDTKLKPFRKLLNIEERGTIPILANPKTCDDNAPSVLYFPGCGSERLFSQIGLATLALLYHAGVRIVLPPGYLCCGYPQRASGDLEVATKIITDNRVLMYRMANTLNYLDIQDIIVSCGTCIDQLFDYKLESIFAKSRLLDIHEYLLEKDITLKNNKQKFLYHAPCHDPIKSKNSKEVIDDLIGTKTLNNDRCCGESGSFAIARPDIAKQVKFKKENEIKKDLNILMGKTKVDKNEVQILTTCPSCRQGLARYESTTGIRAVYPIEILAKNLLGKNWQQDFIKKVNIEKVLL